LVRFQYRLLSGAWSTHQFFSHFLIL
jgi:hypothetical protein